MRQFEQPSRTTRVPGRAHRPGVATEGPTGATK